MLPIILKFKLTTTAMAGWIGGREPGAGARRERSRLMFARRDGGAGRGQPLRREPASQRDASLHRARRLGGRRRPRAEITQPVPLPHDHRERRSRRRRSRCSPTSPSATRARRSSSSRRIASRRGESWTSPHRDGARDRLPHPRRRSCARSATTCGASTPRSASAGTRASSSSTWTRARRMHDTSWTFLHGKNHYHPYWAELARRPAAEAAARLARRSRVPAVLRYRA